MSGTAAARQARAERMTSWLGREVRSGNFSSSAADH